jgi:hypothetical protein
MSRIDSDRDEPAVTESILPSISAPLPVLVLTACGVTDEKSSATSSVLVALSYRWKD